MEARQAANPMDVLRGYEHAIGGFSGGILSTLVCHPMDLLKVRFSANEGNALIRPQYNGYADAAAQIVRSQGIRGLYQGLTPNLCGGALSWGLYLQIYNKVKTAITNTCRTYPEPLNNFASGIVAGSIVMCFTNPIWVAKTRLCLQYEKQATKQYSGMMDCIYKMYRNEGIAGLYRGFLPGLFGTSHGAVQFMIYDFLKDWRCRDKGIEKGSKLSLFDYLAFSSISKMAAVTATYPYQVVRTRMQDHNIVARSAVQTIRHALVEEGPRAFYKGLLIANVRTLPATVVTLMTYEQIHHFIHGS
ncbi:unnamed protein product, partial [Mesorhabditis spiculigera]